MTDVDGPSRFIARLKQAYFRVRYRVRRNRAVAAIVYMVPNIYFAISAWLSSPSPRRGGTLGRVALCLRFRDEAPFLAEWIDYHVAAGVDHFFLYNNFSEDDYRSVLGPAIAAGRVTLIDWPRIPASPDAENDCLSRTTGRFDWVGFIDADEFVVIADNKSIPDYLDSHGDVCAVALHYFYFGSNGHKERPRGRVIDAYTKREKGPNSHFKVFVRPDMTVRNRNSHNFYYRGARRAVNELGQPVDGSMHEPPSAQRAWINHYAYKSLQDYLAKAARRSTLDKSGMREPMRLADGAEDAMLLANDVTDTRAREYLAARQERIRPGA